jgi:hypothetical protein
MGAQAQAVRDDATVHLGDRDLLEVARNARESDATARHYEGVRIQGAVLVQGLAAGARQVAAAGRADGTMVLDDEDLREVSEPRAAAARRRVPTPVPPLALEDDVDAPLTLAGRIAGALGAVAPVRLAVGSFLAGVVTTLIGVAIAL